MDEEIIMDIRRTATSTIHGKPVFMDCDDMANLVAAAALNGDMDTAWHAATGLLPLDKKQGKNVITGTIGDAIASWNC